MTLLNLSHARTAQQSEDGDDAPVVIRRWVAKVVVGGMLTVAVPVVLFGVALQRGQDRNATDISALQRDDVELKAIIKGYEELRVEREKQITELQTQMKYLNEAVTQANVKLDRLLSR